MHPPALLGIDGGGSTTTAWLADRAGTAVGKGRSGPCSLKAVGPERANAALTEAIAAAFADARRPAAPVDVACLGLAGFDRPQDQDLLRGWAERGHWTQRLVLVNDGQLLLAAGTPEGWGLGVIAGTGSIAVGRSTDGRTVRAGGWGHLIGDEGSAYAVALEALRWIARRADGRTGTRSGDSLTEPVCAALGIRGPAQLVNAVYRPEFDRTQIAALAPLVVQAAEVDPAVAQEILVPAARQLAETVIAVARQLGWPEASSADRWPLALGGSFLLHAAIVEQELLRVLAAEGLRVAGSRVEEPVRGAIVLAGRALEEGS
jgi:N-acetylglucosamine kinase-like BadF-type ATPase